MSDRRVRVVRPGLQTTVQDIGRWGHQALGVPVAGPMDAFSHRLANMLVGNDHRAATLEVTLIGPELVFDAEALVVVTGADFDVTADGQWMEVGTAFTVRPGTHVRFARRRAGARAYIGISGGIATPPVLGSRATHVLTGMGGLAGRALQAGDELPLGAEPPAQVPIRRAIGLTLPSRGRARLRVLPGAQDEWFAPDAFTAFRTISFRVSPRSNRMGYRLEGPPLPRGRAGEPISEPVAMGAIQVPAAGEPILLMADRQTAGGYPKIGTVIAADLPVAAQLAPGDAIDFDFCTRQEAAAALIARERQLLRYTDLRTDEPVR
ncbi:MAG: biotin-dependent carboxyltransferase family protein [Vicinamibacterales bacterium]